jgi:hypothetical protein
MPVPGLWQARHSPASPEAPFHRRARAQADVDEPRLDPSRLPSPADRGGAVWEIDWELAIFWLVLLVEAAIVVALATGLVR